MGIIKRLFTTKAISVHIHCDIPSVSGFWTCPRAGEIFNPSMSIVGWTLLISSCFECLLSCPCTAVPRPSPPASHFSQEDKKDSGHTVHLAFFSAACKSLLIAGWLGRFSPYQQQPWQEWSLYPRMVPLLVFSISQHCEFCAWLRSSYLLLIWTEGWVFFISGGSFSYFLENSNYATIVDMPFYFNILTWTHQTMSSHTPFLFWLKR